MHLHKSVIGFATFFLVMALIVPPAQRAHWGMQGIFLAMIAATATSLLAALAFGNIRQRMRTSHIDGRSLAGFLVGYTQESRVVESDRDVRVAPSGDDEQALVPLSYAGEDEEGREDEDLPNVIVEPHGLSLSDTYQPGGIILTCLSRLNVGFPLK